MSCPTLRSHRRGVVFNTSSINQKDLVQWPTQETVPVCFRVHPQKNKSKQCENKIVSSVYRIYKRLWVESCVSRVWGQRYIWQATAGAQFHYQKSIVLRQCKYISLLVMFKVNLHYPDTKSMQGCKSWRGANGRPVSADLARAELSRAASPLSPAPSKFPWPILDGGTVNRVQDLCGGVQELLRPRSTAGESWRTLEPHGGQGDKGGEMWTEQSATTRDGITRELVGVHLKNKQPCNFSHPVGLLVLPPLVVNPTRNNFPSQIKHYDESLIFMFHVTSSLPSKKKKKFLQLETLSELFRTLDPLAPVQCWIRFRQK